MVFQANTLLRLLNLVAAVVFFVDIPDLSLYNKPVWNYEYDYIIVGAGSAGCVLANRLSADGSARVLLLEAGGAEEPAARVPYFSTVLQYTRLDWDYRSEPQQHASYAVEGRINRLPRGKVLGGTSSINHMIYSRGNRLDYDRWQSLYGAQGWAYRDVLPDFISIEKSHLGIYNGFHGSDGEVPVSFPTTTTKAADAFLEAGRELGFCNVDYNGPNQTSFARVQSNRWKGERWSASRAFLNDEVLRRPNLDVAIFSFVTKVLFQEKTAVGVEFKRHQQTFVVRARREVILSAGAVGSPQLLMLSGIGPRQHLESLGINVIADLPVGQSLSDHVTVTGITGIDEESDTENISALEAMAEYSLFGKGPLTYTCGVEGVAFLSTPNADPDIPNIQFLLVTPHLVPTETKHSSKQVSKPYYDVTKGHFLFTIVPILLQPKSRGFIRLKSTNPVEHPLIDLNLLSNKADFETLFQAAKAAVRVVNTEAMKRANVTLLNKPVPGCEKSGPMWSDDYVRCLVRHTSHSGWHPCCTAPMGTHPLAVLDDRLRVRGGVRGLRVVDASSMPDLVSGNINVPLMMMGHRAAFMIMQDNNH